MDTPSPGNASQVQTGKRGRGRPPKSAKTGGTGTPAAGPSSSQAVSVAGSGIKPKRGRGRPSNAQKAAEAAAAAAEAEAEAAARAAAADAADEDASSVGRGGGGASPSVAANPTPSPPHNPPTPLVAASRASSFRRKKTTTTSATTKRSARNGPVRGDDDDNDDGYDDIDEEPRGSSGHLAVDDSRDNDAEPKRGLNVTQFQTYLTNNRPTIHRQTMKTQVLIPLSAPSHKHLELLESLTQDCLTRMSQGKGKGKPVDVLLLKRTIYARILASEHIVKSISEVTDLRYFFKGYKPIMSTLPEGSDAGAGDETGLEVSGLVLYFRCAQIESEDPTCSGTLRIEVKDLRDVTEELLHLHQQTEKTNKDGLIHSLSISEQLNEELPFSPPQPRTREGTYALENPPTPPKRKRGRPSLKSTIRAAVSTPAQSTPANISTTYLSNRISNRKLASRGASASLPPVLVLRVKLTHLRKHKKAYEEEEEDEVDVVHLDEDDDAQDQDLQGHDSQSRHYIKDSNRMIHGLVDRLNRGIAEKDARSLEKLYDALRSVISDSEDEVQVTSKPARKPATSQRQAVRKRRGATSTSASDAVDVTNWDEEQHLEEIRSKTTKRRISSSAPQGRGAYKRRKT